MKIIKIIAITQLIIISTFSTANQTLTPEENKDKAALIDLSKNAACR